jgi:LL-H family phage holin
MDEILQALLMTIIQVLVPVVLGAIIAFIRVKIKEVTAQVDQDQLAFAAELARQFVLAAEQNGLSGAIKNEGSEKKAWALARLDDELDKRGIHLDVNVLSDMLEAAVMESFNQAKV